MLYYPKIGKAYDFPNTLCIAFDKIDGTNMHFDWDREFGWHAFGTRRDCFQWTDLGRQEFSHTHPELADCATLFTQTLADDLEKIFLANPHYHSTNSIRTFAEFAGTLSFAGEHQPDDAMQLVLFDVQLEGYGFIGPRQFVEDFATVRIPRVVYEGRFSGTLSEDVRNGRYQVAEGVIVKAGRGGEDLVMAKIKTQAWLTKLEQMPKRVSVE